MGRSADGSGKMMARSRLITFRCNFYSMLLIVSTKIYSGIR